jgi:hypothetical protein
VRPHPVGSEVSPGKRRQQPGQERRIGIDIEHESHGDVGRTWRKVI